MIAESFTILAEIGDASDRSFVITAKAAREKNTNTISKKHFAYPERKVIKKCASKVIVSGKVIVANYEPFHTIERIRFQ